MPQEVEDTVRRIKLPQSHFYTHAHLFLSQHSAQQLTKANETFSEGFSAEGGNES